MNEPDLKGKQMMPGRQDTADVYAVQNRGRPKGEGGRNPDSKHKLKHSGGSED